MSYEKQTWAYKDEITAEKLNHIEDGIADASQSGGGSEPLIVNINYDESTDTETLDKTWQEIDDAIAQGRQVLIASASPSGGAHMLFPVLSTEITLKLTYIVRYIGTSLDGASLVEVTASSPDGYPSRSSGDSIH